MRWQVAHIRSRGSRLLSPPGGRNAAGERPRGPRLCNGDVQASLDGFARGVELLVQRRSTRGVSGWLAYSYGRIRHTRSRRRGKPTGAISISATRSICIVSYRVSDRTSVSAKVRAGTNVPAPGYYAQEGSDYFVSSTATR